MVCPVMVIKQKRRKRRRRRQREGGRGSKDLLFAAVKLGVKLESDKRCKRMGALGAKGHHRVNPRPWAV